MHGIVLRLGLATLGALALAASFPDLGWWPMAYVALGALWLSLTRASAWGGFFYGWIFGTVFMLPHVWWAHEAVGPVPWVALSIASGLFYGLFGAGWVHVHRSGLTRGSVWLGALAFALLWTGMEALRSMVPFGGFPWGRVAFSQLDSTVASFAWIGGAPFTSFAAALVGALLGVAVESLLKRRLIVAIAAPLAGIAVVVSGLFVPLDGQATTGTLRVGVVQGNVPNEGLDAFSQAREVTRNHRDGTLALMDDAPGTLDLLLWPENSSDYDPRTDEESRALVTEAAQAADAPLLLGTNDYSPPEGRYNSMLLWSPDGAVMDSYSKQRPAPFAEYIPIRDIARRFSPEVDRVQTDVLAGEGPATVALPVTDLGRTVTLGTVICFEVAYDRIVTDAVAAGAEIVLVPTNNASFGETAESTQQLAMSRLRAIETGRATVQASTVGVSAMIDPRGRVLEETGLFTAEQMHATLPLRDGITPAVRFRLVWEWAPLLGALALVGTAITRRLGQRYEW
ncbi:apolipoprotein N-acyltransferase [Demequina muriae]|uniref:Apolipoprotein N-acyltransferase n=1 Tax=Demequina muriae TaxID=3051664 RepID=A0ABT8GKB7_9MICO|nr:apolipoprotein N-acyltransferase [Demequina sp. EGI L300058]MDN4481716.1 apolipoprotein N-acyltransferase [Demequina sp. EGI L300058]